MNKWLKWILVLLVGSILLAGAFAGGFLVGYMLFPSSSRAHILPVPTPVVPQPPSTEQQSATPEDLQTLFAPFWETWNIVHEQYVDQPVDDLALMRGAIRGMLEALGDKHTSYMDPEEFKEANEALSGEYEGIGAYVDVSGEYLTIISPISGSPAEAAGLRPGDQIIAINGEDMTGINPEIVRKKVLGPAGTTVTLTIRRGDQPPFDVTITRARIVIRSVEGKMLEGGFAYVKLSTFGDKTTRELDETLKTLMAENPRGLILDLRNNGGGYLTTAVEVASQFLPRGAIVLYEQYGSGERDEYRSQGGGRAVEIPMVVLINEGSASASELVAGALRDHQRALLVGVVSYGKGSIQNWVPLSNDQGAVRVTIAKWLTPNGRTIHNIGLLPDVYVSITEEDYRNDRDPQLDAAVQTLEAILTAQPVPTSMPTVTPAP